MDTTSPAAIVYNRKNPFPGKLLVNHSLCSAGVDKDTRHYEISIKGSGLTYEVGDALGVFPQNDAELVNEILNALGLSGEETVASGDGSSMTLRKALTSECQITQTDRKFVEAVALKAGDHDLQALATDPARKDAFEQYLWGREVIDMLTEYPTAKFAASEFASLLRKLQPRLYSIASSQKLHADEVHLCVATLGYKTLGRRRKGVCSNFLANRVTLNETALPLFFHTAKHFRLPDDPNIPVIMVGPGTGIAPFRAYLEERRAIGAKGKSWLFFGSQRESCDFLYKDELAKFMADGVLHKLTNAFSRDQEHKIYVQNRMAEEGGEIWKWLEEGAYFYVCGDAKKMAKDVDDMLVTIGEKIGGLTHDEAIAYVQKMRTTKRYRRDVY